MDKKKKRGIRWNISLVLFLFLFLFFSLLLLLFFFSFHVYKPHLFLSLSLSLTFFLSLCLSLSVSLSVYFSCNVTETSPINEIREIRCTRRGVAYPRNKNRRKKANKNEMPRKKYCTVFLEKERKKKNSRGSNSLRIRGDSNGSDRSIRLERDGRGFPFKEIIENEDGRQRSTKIALLK